MPAHTLREPLTEDDTLSLYEEATGYFTLRTDDGCIELSPEEFADLISAGAHRLGLRLTRPTPVPPLSLAKREGV